MSQRGKSADSIPEILERLASELAALTEAANARRPSAALRRQLDSRLGALIARAETLLREVDPVRLPEVVFDPSDPAVVGRFIALALIAQPRVPLPSIEQFYGSGVYALYYTGGFDAYSPISGTENPIYVGKADAKSDTARTPIEQGPRLFIRLKDHHRNIGKAVDTLDAEDFYCRFLVVQTGWQGAAEDYLIDMFQPIWNNETGICHGLGKHGDAPSTRANRRSPWDTLHPGREWAWRDPRMGDARSHDRILADLERYFSTCKIYVDITHVFQEFVDKLRQV